MLGGLFAVGSLLSFFVGLQLTNSGNTTSAHIGTLFMLGGMGCAVMAIGAFFVWADPKEQRKRHLRANPISIKSVPNLSPKVEMKRYGTPCQICGSTPSSPTHGCFAMPTLLKVGSKPLHTYVNGPNGVDLMYRGIYQAQIIDRYGVVWKCSHRHDGREYGFQCALRHFQLHVAGECSCIKILGFRAELTPVQRLPIANLTESRWKKILQDAGHLCQYCGSAPQRFEKEHFIPLSRGGLNSIENIVPACPPCNRFKGSMTGSEWMQIVSQLKQQGRWPPTDAWSTSIDIRISKET